MHQAADGPGGRGSLRRGCELSSRAHLCRDRAEVEPLPGRGPDNGRAGEGVTCAEDCVCPVPARRDHLSLLRPPAWPCSVDVKC